MKESEQRRKNMMARMDLEQKDAEMQILRKMNQKLNFMRNPRHVKGAHMGLLDPDVVAHGGVESLKRTMQEASRISTGLADTKDAQASAAQRTKLTVQTKAALGLSLRYPLSASAVSVRVSRAAKDAPFSPLGPRTEPTPPLPPCLSRSTGPLALLSPVATHDGL